MKSGRPNRRHLATLTVAALFTPPPPPRHRSHPMNGDDRDPLRKRGPFVFHDAKPTPEHAPSIPHLAEAEATLNEVAALTRRIEVANRSGILTVPCPRCGDGHRRGSKVARRACRKAHGPCNGTGYVQTFTR